MSPDIKISVCIPIYKVEHYIEQCARSLFEQTLEDMEFIFVDDATPDKSVEILKNIISEYPCRQNNISIIELPEHKGLVNARSVAIARCRGEYVAHCDSDDWVEPDMYEKMYQAAVAGNADMVYCDFQREFAKNSRKNIVRSGGTTENVDIFINDMLSGKISWNLWNKLFKRQIAQVDHSAICPLHICYGEDILRTSSMLRHCRTVAGVHECMYHYRVRRDSMVGNYMVSRESRKNFLEAVSILDRIFVEDKYQDAMNFCRRYALYIALSIPDYTAKEWHNTYKQAKRGFMWDKKFPVSAKIFFIGACLNFTFSHFIYLLLWDSFVFVRELKDKFCSKN
ncbi:MAG: glycosyltransferase family 2 protein [Lentisphaeria bacterium]|nr:glycosyltransferase family 2 protein [Lentisphaeria bacterium]